MKLTTIMLSLILGSWGAYAQHEHAGHDQKKSEQAAATFKDAKLGNAYTHYILVKNELVDSDSENARKNAIELQKSLAGLSDSKTVQSAVAKFISAKDLSEQRQHFSALSNEITTLVKGGKLATGSLYLEYCPMANNNTGAYWLSNEKEIKNPYFGSKMLKCGSVKETIQ